MCCGCPSTLYLGGTLHPRESTPDVLHQLHYSTQNEAVRELEGSGRLHADQTDRSGGGGGGGGEATPTTLDQGFFQRGLEQLSATDAVTQATSLYTHQKLPRATQGNVQILQPLVRHCSVAVGVWECELLRGKVVSWNAGARNVVHPDCPRSINHLRTVGGHKVVHEGNLYCR
jgi:hypothetical protein